MPYKFISVVWQDSQKTLGTTPLSLRSCFNSLKYCAVYDYSGKADLSKGYWSPKRKLGVTTHFSEIIKQQYFKKSPKYYKAMHGIFY